MVAVQGEGVAAGVGRAGDSGYFIGVVVRGVAARNGVIGGVYLGGVAGGVYCVGGEVSASFQPDWSYIGYGAVGADVNGEGALYCVSA